MGSDFFMNPPRETESERRKRTAPKRKRRQHDYIGELIEMMRGWKDIDLRERMYRRVLRKLVREAVTKAHDLGSYGDKWVRRDADRIAKELIP